jgi:NitT/TauT family transport system ATP-binding protein
VIESTRAGRATRDATPAGAPPPPAAGGAVRIDRLSMTFTARRTGALVRALEDVSLDIAPGEFVSFVGASGSGKSTLLKIVAGLLAPTGGTVGVDGTPVVRPRPSVGIMFQQPELFPWRSALENTLLPVDVRRGRRPEHVERARAILELVGLTGFEHAYPRELSGGMQQRVALSRTLMADPALLLMDEPFGALDELTRERLDFELLRIWEQERKTVLFVTHSVGEAVLLSDRVVVLASNPGRVVEVLPVDLPRPRTVDTMREPRYIELAFRARQLLGVTQ